MKVTRFISVSLVWIFMILLIGCDKGSRQNTIHLVVEGDPNLKAAVEKMFAENAAIMDAVGEHTIMIVKPDPGTDYIIAKVTPKSDMDYSIIILDPKTQRKIPGLSKQMENLIRKQIQEQLRKSRK
jgi:hypothetical protein